MKYIASWSGGKDSTASIILAHEHNEQFIHAGEKSWLAQKYGVLPPNYKEYIRDGFNECMRVLKPTHTLIFKWNEEQIKLSEILKVIKYKPLSGDKRSKTRWIVFMK